MVEDFDDLIDQMVCDHKDRHVLAVAVHDRADAVLTFNLKDFPPPSADPYGIQILHPESLLLQLLDSSPVEVVAALRSGVRDCRNPPETVASWLGGLTSTVPTFANLAADFAGAPPGALSPVPALMAADEAAALAAFGRPGDLTNPAQVAFAWWSGLLGDHGRSRGLTYNPAAWGDYRWAVDHLAGRSLASKVVSAVDAPDRIAYLRFVPEVAQPSQVFAPFHAAMTFLILVRITDGTWRVWGLGPSLPAASQVLAG